MNPRGLAFLDGKPVDLLQRQVVVDRGSTVTKWFVRYDGGGTGWVAEDRLDDITLDDERSTPTPPSTHT